MVVEAAAQNGSIARIGAEDMAGNGRETGWLRGEKRDPWELRGSLQMLHALGFAPWAIEYYRQEARREQKLPHEIVRAVAYETVRKTIGSKPNRASPHRGAVPKKDLRSNGPTKPGDRRAGSLAGLMRRQGFEKSLNLLSQCGFEGWAVEACGLAARAAGMLPHDLVRCVAESSAWHKLNSDPEAWRRTNGDHPIPREAVEIPTILLRRRTS